MRRYDDSPGNQDIMNAVMKHMLYGDSCHDLIPRQRVREPRGHAASSRRQLPGNRNDDRPRTPYQKRSKAQDESPSTFSCGNAHVRQFGEGVESGRRSSSENLEQDVLRFVFKRLNSSQLSCCLSVYLSICLSVCLRLNVVFELRLHVAFALRFFHCLRGIVWNTKRCEQSGHGAGGTTKLQGQRLCNQSCRPNSSWP